MWSVEARILSGPNKSVEDVATPQDSLVHWRCRTVNPAFVANLRWIGAAVLLRLRAGGSAIRLGRHCAVQCIAALRGRIATDVPGRAFLSIPWLPTRCLRLCALHSASRKARPHGHVHVTFTEGAVSFIFNRMLMVPICSEF